MRRNLSDRRTGWRAGERWLALAVFLTTPGRLAAQGEPLNAAALFLVLPVGAQAVGMGQTATAASGTSEAAFWNPAGLATISDDEFALHSATLVAGRSHVLGAYFPSRSLGVLGGAVYLVDYGNIPATVDDGTGTVVGQVAVRNLELLASYATNLAGSFVFGLNYKLVQFRVDCSGVCPGVTSGAGTTHAVDLGGQFRVGPGGPLRVGVALRNVGFRLQVQNQAQADELPARLAIGALYELRFHPADGATDRKSVV